MDLAVAGIEVDGISSVEGKQSLVDESNAFSAVEELCVAAIDAEGVEDDDSDGELDAAEPDENQPLIDGSDKVARVACFFPFMWLSIAPSLILPKWISAVQIVQHAWTLEVGVS